MARRSGPLNTSFDCPERPALTPDESVQQCISAAYDLAYQQLKDGTASSSVIVQFLKMGTSIADLEREKLEKETELLRAKTETLKSAARTEELYANAIKSMQVYSGNGAAEDYADIF